MEFIDFAEVHRTDQHLDLLSSAQPPEPADEFDGELLAWRNDVDSTPIPELVDLKTAVATVKAARKALKAERRWWRKRSA